MTAKQQYKQAHHAIRNLRRYGHTYLAHGYFLRRVRVLRIDILNKAYEGLR